MFSRSFRWLGTNIGTLLLAFALALTVWVSSVIAADPNEECTVPNTISLEIIGEDASLERMNEIPAQVRIDLFAPRSICAQLQEEGIPSAKLDLTGLGPGTHTVAVAMPVITAKPARTLDYFPKEVSISFERLINEKYPVLLVVLGEPDLGFQAEAPLLETVEVTVSGPESAVRQVADVQAVIDISDARETLVKTVTLQPLDSDGDSVNGVALAPSRMVVTQPISQLGRYRELAVQVKTTGQWDTGYRLTSISVSPPTVTVFAVEPSQVSALPGFVETEPIDLTGASDDVVASVALNLPDGVSLVGRETVLVQVSIAAIENNLIINLPVELIGLNPEYEVQISPEVVDVILFGPLPILETLTPANVRVIVDLTDLDVGTWQLTPLVDILPDGVRVEGINPASVELILSLIPTVTPTPTLELTPTLTTDLTPQPTITPTTTP